MASTSDRGYGTEHQAIRRQLLAALVDGDLCDRCYQPMRRGQALDAAHPHHRPATAGGKADHLEHVKCNRGAPGRERAQRSSRRLNTSRDW